MSVRDDQVQRVKAARRAYFDSLGGDDDHAHERARAVLFAALRASTTEEGIIAALRDGTPEPDEF